MPAIAIDPTAITVAGWTRRSRRTDMQATTAGQREAAVKMPTAALAKSIKRRATPPVRQEGPGEDEERDRQQLLLRVAWKNSGDHPLRDSNCRVVCPWRTTTYMFGAC